MSTKKWINLGRTNAAYRGIFKGKTQDGPVYRAVINRNGNFQSKTFIFLEDALDWRRAEMEHKSPTKRPGTYTMKELSQIVLKMSKGCATFAGIEFHHQRFLEIVGDIQLEQFVEFHVDLVQDHLDSIVSERTKTPLANQTKDHCLIQLRRCLNTAWERGWVRRKIRVPLFGKYGERELPITPDDFNKVINLLRPFPWPHKPMLIMALVTGQRFGTVRMMRWDQIKGPFAPGAKLVYSASKGGRKHISIPLTDELHQVLAPFREVNKAYMFLHPKTKKPFGDPQKWINTACKKAGVPRFTPHDLRHLATTLYLRQTQDRVLTARLIGWSSQRMVDRYDHLLDAADSPVIELSRRLEVVG